MPANTFGIFSVRLLRYLDVHMQSVAEQIVRSVTKYYAFSKIQEVSPNILGNLRRF